MKSILLFGTLLLALSLPSRSCAESPHTPPAGSQERKEIMNALREPVQAELKKPVLFKPALFNVLGDWAFVQGTPLKPDGSAMDYKGTTYEELVKDGTFEDMFNALLKKDDDGKWQVITWNIGATDAIWVGWDEQYKAPKAILPQ